MPQSHLKNEGLTEAYIKAATLKKVSLHNQSPHFQENSIIVNSLGVRQNLIILSSDETIDFGKSILRRD